MRYSNRAGREVPVYRILLGNCSYWDLIDTLDIADWDWIVDEKNFITGLCYRVK